MKIFSKIVLLGASACCTMVWAVDKCKVGADFGAISIENRDGMITAVYDGDSYESIEIPADCEIDYYVIKRAFPKAWEKTATIVLPFDFESKWINEAGAQAIGLTKIDVSNPEALRVEANNWSGGVYPAYTPFFLRTQKDSLFFTIENGKGKGFPVVLKASANVLDYARIKGDDGVETDWVFRSSLGYRKWEKGDSDLGRVYGFVAYDINNLKQGEFRKVTVGSVIRSLRAYLSYEPKTQGVRAIGASETIASLDEVNLPETIEVRFKDTYGELTGISKISTRTGVFVENKWFDAKGRGMSHKPSSKGSFYNDGNKVIVK